MGGHHSSRPQSALEDKQIAIAKKIEETMSIDRFVKYSLSRLEMNESLMILLNNPFAYETYISYLYLTQKLNSDTIDNSSITIIVDAAIKDKFQNREYFQELLETIPDYLESDFFRQWRRNEAHELMVFDEIYKVCTTTTLPDLLPSSNKEDSSISVAEAALMNRDSSLFCEVKISMSDTASSNYTPICTPYSPITSTIAKALESCYQKDLFDIFVCSNWLPSLITAAEDLPFALTVSRAESHCSFPIIYVNKRFEDMSGRHRSEIIGHPGTFMQTRGTLYINQRMKLMDKLFRKIENKENQVIVLTSCHSSGNKFTNVLGVIPLIESSSCDIKYILTIQMRFQITSDITRLQSYIKELSSILSNTL